jgi:hypothetical protein
MSNKDQDYQRMFKKFLDPVIRSQNKTEGISDINFIDIKQFSLEQAADHYFSKILEKFDSKIKEGITQLKKDGEWEISISPFSSYVIKSDGRLWNRIYKKSGLSEVIDRLCIPKERIPEVLRYLHDSSHFSISKVYPQASRRFFWRGM